MACHHELLQRATMKHGMGVLVSALEALCDAHSVHTERAPHGFFLKAFFGKRRPASSSTASCKSSPPSSPGNRKSSQGSVEFPAHSPPGLSAGSNETDEEKDEEVNQPHSKASRELLLSYRPSRLQIKNTFVHFASSASDTSEGALSAPGQLQSYGVDKNKDWEEFYMGTRIDDKGIQCDDCAFAAVDVGVNTDPPIQPSLCHSEAQSDRIDMTNVAVQVDDPGIRAQEDYQSLLTLKGTWLPVNPCTTLQSDTVIRTNAGILSADSVPVTLQAGDVGIIKNFDKDGDARAYFPKLGINGAKSVIFIFAQDFTKLQTLST